MKFILNILKNHPKLLRLVKKVINIIKKNIYKYFNIFVKVDEKMVIFDSFLGKSYSCNPRYIYEEMRKDPDFNDWKFIWSMRNIYEEIPDAKIVRYNSLKYLYYLSKSKYWVFNSKMPSYIIKKNNQIYLQTWHGTPLKKLARDIEIAEEATFYRSKMSKAEMVKTYDDDVKRYNYLISPNPYSTDKFISAFGVSKEKIIETGYPRNDILSNYTNFTIEEIKNKLGIKHNKKVVLYAPTWRDNIYNNKGYSFTPKVDFSKWRRELGEDYFIIYKPHYLISNNLETDDMRDFIYFASALDNIADLYLVSDILITDYSSVFFDYSILKRPILFYMFDLDEYKNEIRGFYIDINKLPGPIIENEEELLRSIKNIHKIDYEYIYKYMDFSKEIACLEDGNASQRVIEKVFKG